VSSGHLAKLGKHSSVLLVSNLLVRGVGMILIPLYTGVLTRELFNYWEALLLHASVQTTERSYIQLQVAGLAGAVAKLPGLPSRTAAEATGTDGREGPSDLQQKRQQ
jgi:hypothetical protein